MKTAIKNGGTIICSPIEGHTTAAILKNDITTGENLLPGTISLAKATYGSCTLAGNYTPSTDTLRGCNIGHYNATLSSSYQEIIRWGNVLYPVLGATYTFSFWARGSGKVRLYFYGDSGYLAVASLVNSEGYSATNGDGWNDITLTPDWKYHWVKYTLKSSGSTTVYKHLLVRHVYEASNATVDMYITEPKLEKSDKYTPWSPSSTDTGLGSTTANFTSPFRGNEFYEI